MTAKMILAIPHRANWITGAANPCSPDLSETKRQAGRDPVAGFPYVGDSVVRTAY